MTDNEIKRRKAICDAAGVDEIGKLSDGFHTFNSLYEQRMILFAALAKAYKNQAWKSYRHEDGEYCFGGGWFIVGIDTPEGSYTYHYENKYWDMFDCIDLPRAKHWDGHTEEDAETRLMSLEPQRWVPVTEKVPDHPYRFAGWDSYGSYSLYESDPVLAFGQVEGNGWGVFVARYYRREYEDGGLHCKWIVDVNNLDRCRVMAWMKLPDAYKGE